MVFVVGKIYRHKVNGAKYKIKAKLNPKEYTVLKKGADGLRERKTLGKKYLESLFGKEKGK